MKLIIFLLTVVHLVGLFVYLLLNPTYYLTSKTYTLEYPAKNSNLEKTITVILNSADFQKYSGVEYGTITASDVAPNVFVLKTSAPTEKLSQEKFNTNESKLITGLKNQRPLLQVADVSDSALTSEVGPQYLKILTVFILSLSLTSAFFIISKNYLSE